MHRPASLLQGHNSLGMGSWHLGQGRRSLEEEKAALLTGLQLGLTVIDTAEMYGDGLSEELIGDVLREWSPRRSRPFLVSKVLPMHASRKGVMSAFEGSADRLGVLPPLWICSLVPVGSPRACSARVSMSSLR